MAHMLDGPVPDGARSVSWPWYHHVLTNELTPDARTLFEEYAGVQPRDVENHIYRIRDKAWGIFPWPCIGEFWFLSFGLAKHPLYHNLVLPRLKTGDSLLDLGSCMGQDLRKLVFDGAPSEKLYASDVFPQYEGLSYELWRDKDSFPHHFLADDVLADNENFMKGSLMTKLGPGQTDIIAINMFLHLFDYENQLKVATRILRLLSQRPGSLILGSQAGVRPPMEQPLKPPFDKTEDGETRTIYRHSPDSFIDLWNRAGAFAGVPIRVWADFQIREKKAEQYPPGVDTGLEAVASRKPFTAEDLFSTSSAKKVLFSTEPEARRLYFSIIRT